MSSLTIEKPNYEVHGGTRQHGPVGVQVLRSDGRHHGVDDKPPSPSVHGSVRVELPLDLVTGDPDFRGPVAPVTSGPDADDPSCAVHDGQRIVPTFSRTLPVKFDSERLRARNPDMTGLASVIWIMNKFNSYSLKHKWDYTHYIKFKKTHKLTQKDALYTVVSSYHYQYEFLQQINLSPLFYIENLWNLQSISEEFLNDSTLN